MAVFRLGKNVLVYDYKFITTESFTIKLNNVLLTEVIKAMALKTFRYSSQDKSVA
ncbi:hypothetical protein [uncultured Gammaproteobacteria bacterium]|nr:hypothetical protein [uncultured Gammaproteobacteria bacterium]